jgi:hypothetical protein
MGNWIINLNWEHNIDIWLNCRQKGLAAIGWWNASDKELADDSSYQCAIKFFRKIKPGDRIVAFLMDYRLGGWGTVTKGYDAGIFEPQHRGPDGPDFGRVIRVRWDENETPPLGKAAVMKPEERYGFDYRYTVRSLKDAPFERLKAIMSNSDRWVKISELDKSLNNKSDVSVAENLKRELNSVGEKCFVDYYKSFSDFSIPNAEIAQKIKNDCGFTMNSCNSRTSHARSIINKGHAIDVLKIIVNSQRIGEDIKLKATDLLKTLSGPKTKIEIDDIRLLQAQFEPTRIDRQKEYQRYHALRGDFVGKFPIGDIKTMTLDRYCIGAGGKNSFCYWVEQETRPLGSILGATAKKFGVYYDKKAKSYIHLNRYKTPTEALIDMRQIIDELLAAAGRDDLRSIIENKLSPMFKGKLLSLYFPDKFIPIFSDEHLSHFLAQIGEPSSGLDWVSKNRHLMNFKNDDAVMRNWSVYEFMHFLYDVFKRPTDTISPADVSPELKNYLDMPGDFPDPKNIVMEQVVNKISKPADVDRRPKSSGYGASLSLRVNQEETGRRGLQGELLAIRFEEERLKKIGRADLAKKIVHVAKINSCAGYDVQSFNNDGTERFIEVKATVSEPADETAFYFTRNEYETAVQKTNEKADFYIYRVFGVKSRKPKVACISWSDIKNTARFTPLVYDVTYGIKPDN